MNNPHGDAVLALTSWSHTLYEPLLPFRSVARRLDHLARVHARSTEIVHTFFSGVVSDMVLSLPETDPWRGLSGHFGNVFCGTNPPPFEGARFADGKSFSSWENTLDVVPLIHILPSDDPNLIALYEDPLEPAAAAIIAAGAQGQAACFEMICEVFASPLPDASELGSITDIGTRESYRTGAALHRVREACMQAVRWSLHRRRGYTGPDDMWPSESTFNWAWRARKAADGRRWEDSVVASSIASWAVRTPPRLIFDDDDSKWWIEDDRTR